MESIKHHLSKFQLAVASGCHALRKIRVSPRLPANGSFSRQSLAYVHAGTRYIKQVSGLLKTSVTTLRNSSSSYEVVQGMKIHRCQLYLLVKKEKERDNFFPYFYRDYDSNLLKDFGSCLCICHQKLTLAF